MNFDFQQLNTNPYHPLNHKEKSKESLTVTI